MVAGVVGALRMSALLREALDIGQCLRKKRPALVDRPLMTKVNFNKNMDFWPNWSKVGQCALDSDTGNPHHAVASTASLRFFLDFVQPFCQFFGRWRRELRIVEVIIQSPPWFLYIVHQSEQSGDFLTGHPTAKARQV